MAQQYRVSSERLDTDAQYNFSSRIKAAFQNLGNGIWNAAKGLGNGIWNAAKGLWSRGTGFSVRICKVLSQLTLTSNLVQWMNGFTWGRGLLRQIIRVRTFVVAPATAVLQALVSAGSIYIPQAAMTKLLIVTAVWTVLEIGSGAEHLASPVGPTEKWWQLVANGASALLNFFFGHHGFFGHNSHAPTAQAEGVDDLASVLRFFWSFFETSVDAQHVAHTGADSTAVHGGIAILAVQLGLLWYKGYGLVYALSGWCLGLTLPTFIAVAAGTYMCECLISWFRG